MRGLFALLLSLDSRKRQFLRENIMVLNGATEHEELALMPVNGFDTACEPDAKPLPAFIFGDDDDLDDEDDIEDEGDNYDEDEDDYGDDELDEDDEDGDFDDEDEDFDEEDDEDWDEEE
jgi:hypothetical protein